MNDEEFYYYYEPLLREVRCHFIFSPQPHTSARSPDKPRYHIFDRMQDKHLLIDTEDDLKAFIRARYLELAK